MNRLLDVLIFSILHLQNVPIQPVKLRENYIWSSKVDWRRNEENEVGSGDGLNRGQFC
jgi:hypothetical protein